MDIVVDFSEDGATPLTVLEEVSEGVSKHLRDSGGVPLARQAGWLREAEANTQQRFLQDDHSTLTPELRRQAVAADEGYQAPTGEAPDPATWDLQRAAYGRQFLGLSGDPAEEEVFSANLQALDRQQAQQGRRKRSSMSRFSRGRGLVSST